MSPVEAGKSGEVGKKWETIRSYCPLTLMFDRAEVQNAKFTLFRSACERWPAVSILFQLLKFHHLIEIVLVIASPPIPLHWRQVAPSTTFAPRQKLHGFVT